MFLWRREWWQHCLGTFLVCRWSPVGMPGVVQGTRWGFNSCLWSPPAAAKPESLQCALTLVFPFTDKGRDSPRTPSVCTGLCLPRPVEGTQQGHNHANMFVLCNEYKKLTLMGGCPKTPKD